MFPRKNNTRFLLSSAEVSPSWTCAGGILKIEDVLPFFPDFVTIDNFKDAICDSLERYNRQVRLCIGACGMV
jgi:hypothetical protein